MKKNLSKVLLSAFTLLIVFSLMSSSNVTAVETPDQIIDVQGDTIQTKLQSNVRTMFWFRERTRLTVCANIGLELDINCEALIIGEKDVIIEVEGNSDLKMTMTCTREEAQLGLMNGHLNRARNRNSYRYLEGFCIAMEGTTNCKCECKCDPNCTCACDCECKCDLECTCPSDCECKCKSECSCECDCLCKCDPVCDCECPYNGAFLKARLRIRETIQNRQGQWAYYDQLNDEWITVQTVNQEGYLTADINVLSTWALLVPEETASVTIGIVTIALVSALGILTISVFYLKKRH